MDEGVVFSKLLETMVSLERGQRQIAEQAALIHNREVQKIFEDLTQPKKR